MEQEVKPFYENGLHFECQKDCSACCGGSPGYVWLSSNEVTAISRHLKITVPEFIEQYTKDVDGMLSLIDIEEDNWNCIMLQDGKCTIYEERPIQCRTYPFWGMNIASDFQWKKTGKDCPGVNKGRFYTKEQIESICNEDETIDSIR